MNADPPLDAGEKLVFSHVPSLRSFKKTALLMLILNLPVVAVFLYVFPDTIWPVVPLFVACLTLMQERVRLGRYRAWVTNQRIILQEGRSIPFEQIIDIGHRGNGVRMTIKGHRGKGIKLYYPEDPALLIDTIENARDMK